MKVTIEKVENGYIVTTTDGKTYVASEITSYGTKVTVMQVLEEIFSKKEVKE